MIFRLNIHILLWSLNLTLNLPYLIIFSYWLFIINLIKILTITFLPLFFLLNLLLSSQISNRLFLPSIIPNLFPAHKIIPFQTLINLSLILVKLIIFGDLIMTEKALPIAFVFTQENPTKNTSGQKLMPLAIAATFLSSFTSHYNGLKGIKLKDFF